MKSQEDILLLVSLKSKPKDDVRVDITVSDDAEAFISTGSYLQFTKDNWDTAQSVVVSDPDYFNDGDQDYQVILSTSQSQDMTYKDLGSSVINMKNINIDFNLNFLKLEQEQHKVQDMELYKKVITALVFIF